MDNDCDRNPIELPRSPCRDFLLARKVWTELSNDEVSMWLGKQDALVFPAPAERHVDRKPIRSRLPLQRSGM